MRQVFLKVSVKCLYTVVLFQNLVCENPRKPGGHDIMRAFFVSML